MRNNSLKSRTVICTEKVDGSLLKGALLLLKSETKVPDYLILGINDSFVDEEDRYLVDFLRYVYSNNFYLYFVDSSNLVAAAKEYLILEKKIKDFYNQESGLVIDKSNEIYDIHVVIYVKESTKTRILQVKEKLEEATLTLKKTIEAPRKESFMSKIKAFLESLCR